MDDYPMGTNAIVAVISYTGYDMEDAMIINKSSYERGFAAGSIYKATFVDLIEVATGRKANNRRGNSQVCERQLGMISAYHSHTWSCFQIHCNPKGIFLCSAHIYKIMNIFV